MHRVLVHYGGRFLNLNFDFDYLGGCFCFVRKWGFASPFFFLLQEWDERECQPCGFLVPYFCFCTLLCFVLSYLTLFISPAFLLGGLKEKKERKKERFRIFCFFQTTCIQFNKDQNP